MGQPDSTGVEAGGPAAAAESLSVAQRSELAREAATMILYVSVVEIAELAALPESRISASQVTGPLGAQLLAIVWGTAVGLALAHWFAFRLVAPAFRGDHPTRHDTMIGLVQLGGAAFVAAVSSLPVLFVPDDWARAATGAILALIIGVLGYFLARATGKGRVVSFLLGAGALAVGVLVAWIKSSLAAH